MIRSIKIVALPLLMAGAIAFCSPRPAHASESQYVDCDKLARDVSTVLRIVDAGLLPKNWKEFIRDNWYIRVVMEFAAKAKGTEDPAQTVRDMHKACLLETT